MSEKVILFFVLLFMVFSCGTSSALMIIRFGLLITLLTIGMWLAVAFIILMLAVLIVFGGSYVTAHYKRR